VSADYLDQHPLDSFHYELCEQCHADMERYETVERVAYGQRPDLDRYAASKARREASAARTRAYRVIAATHVLDATNPVNTRNLADERRFVPGFYWTPVWTDEARRAFYGLPR
jgi:hypothetical protein